MAIRTIAPGGGNWNSTSTWVGGVVPISGDVVVGDASSGNLTINVNPNFTYVMDMTNYAATMSIANLAFTMPSHITGYTTSTFSSTMTITYSSVNNICSRVGTSAYTWSFLGDGPYGEFPTTRFSTNAQNLTIDGVMKINTFDKIGSTNAFIVNKATGGGTMSIVNFQNNNQSATMNGNCPIVFDRGDCSWIQTATGFGAFGANPIIINTTGTFTISGSGGDYGFLAVRSNASLTHIQGTILGQKNLHINNASTSTATLIGSVAVIDVASAGTWSSVHISNAHTSGSYSGNTLNTVNLVSDLYFDELKLLPNDAVPQYVGGRSAYRQIIRFSGSGRLKGGYIIGNTYPASWNIGTTVPNYNGVAYFTTRVQLANGLPVNKFKGIRLYGIPDGTNMALTASYCQLSSTTAGTLAYIEVEEPTSFGVLYTDIDASAGTGIKNYFGTSSNSSNITDIQALPSGGGESSFTYVN